MKKAITILLLSSLMIISPIALAASADEFALDISVTSMTPAKIYTGDTVTLTVEISNVSTDSSEKLWGALIFIDQTLINQNLLDYMTIYDPEGVSVEYDGNEHQGTEIWPGDVVYADITFKLDENAPGGVYQIPIVLTGKRGPCTQGCHPWMEEPIYYSINIIHGIPALSISFSENNIATLGDTLMIGFTLKNLGSDDAMNITPSIVSDYPSLVGQINLSGDQTTLQPNQTLDGTMAIYTSSVGVGEYNIQLYVDFADRKSKTYLQKKSVSFSVLESSELTYEERGDALYDSALGHYSESDYKNAIIDFSVAKGFFDMAGAEEKSSSCATYLDTIYLELETSLTPEPVVEEIEHFYLLIVGLVAGFVATISGFLLGMSKARKNG
ncbi:MAG: hypothetical protein JW825_06915 [Candidatus Methanofastidiosa archaeon]|nr:hypothetical protein [Candidatus Methanofastidiosa archaeon]